MFKRKGRKISKEKKTKPKSRKRRQTVDVLVAEVQSTTTTKKCTSNHEMDFENTMTIGKNISRFNGDIGVPCEEQGNFLRSGVATPKAILSVDLTANISTSNETVIPNQSTNSNWNSKLERSYEQFKKISHDYEIFKALFEDTIMAEQEKMLKTIEEVDRLHSYSISLEMEAAKIKRKRWCIQCQMEAKYLSTKGHYFLCSRKCEDLYESSLGS